MKEQEQLTVANSAGALIEQGVRIVQMRTDRQLMVAAQRPRDEARFAAALEAEAEDAGEEFFYAWDVKDHVQGCVGAARRTCNCPAEEISGPSVQLARSAARTWGNCDVASRIVADLPTHWEVESTFVDFQRNYTRTETGRVSKLRELSGGRVVTLRPEQLEIAFKIGVAKIERNAIVNALPRAVLRRVQRVAMEAALAKVDDKATAEVELAKAARWFQQRGVPLEVFERYVGAPANVAALRKAGKDPAAVVASLRGTVTAIREGQTTTAEVFGLEGPKPADLRQQQAEREPGEDELEVEDLMPAAQIAPCPGCGARAAVAPGAGCPACGLTWREREEILAGNNAPATKPAQKGRQA